MVEQPERKSLVGKYLRESWLVIACAIVFGCALAGVAGATRDRIERNKQEATQAAIREVVPGAARGVELSDAEPADLADGIYRALDADGTQVGWAVTARGAGFADMITVLVGLKPDGISVTGIAILESNETPGLGDKIKSGPRYRDQFAGTTVARPIEGVPRTEPADGNKIHTITAATISSQSVVAIINQRCVELGPRLGRLAEDLE